MVMQGMYVCVCVLQDLQDRIAELERELGGDRDKDKEMQELRRKLAEAKAKRREMEAALAAKDREIKVGGAEDGKVGGAEDGKLGTCHAWAGLVFFVL